MTCGGVYNVVSLCDMPDLAVKTMEVDWRGPVIMIEGIGSRTLQHAERGGTMTGGQTGASQITRQTGDTTLRDCPTRRSPRTLGLTMVTGITQPISHPASRALTIACRTIVMVCMHSYSLNVHYIIQHVDSKLVITRTRNSSR